MVIKPSNNQYYWSSLKKYEWSVELCTWPVKSAAWHRHSFVPVLFKQKSLKAHFAFFLNSAQVDRIYFCVSNNLFWILIFQRIDKFFLRIIFLKKFITPFRNGHARFILHHINTTKIVFFSRNYFIWICVLANLLDFQLIGSKRRLCVCCTPGSLTGFLHNGKNIDFFIWLILFWLDFLVQFLMECVYTKDPVVGLL